jgi:sialidase-1
MCCGLLTLAAASHAIELRRTDVFVGGQEGFPTYRIPSVVVSTNGTVLAFAEGRKSRNDQAENKLVLKRSTDNGATWLPLQIIADSGKNSLNNPCAVVERTTGRVLLMYQSYPAGIAEFSPELGTGTNGLNIVRSWLITSDNDGKTWSPPQDLTRFCKFPTNASTIASGPGIGIQLQHGPKAGRLIIPFNEGPPHHWNVYAVFSDDHGKTWQMSHRAPGSLTTTSKGNETSLVNEVQMVELADGSVMLNSRSYGGKRLRKTAISTDAGVNWSKIEEDEHLREPRCMASVLRYSFEPSIILYSGPDSSERRNGVIRTSHDEAKTWPMKKVLEPGKFAYSCLTRLADGRIGCFYETGHDAAYEKIAFVAIPLDWLTAP